METSLALLITASVLIVLVIAVAIFYTFVTPGKKTKKTKKKTKKADSYRIEWTSSDESGGE